jgi:hypothetical protein
MIVCTSQTGQSVNSGPICLMLNFPLPRGARQHISYNSTGEEASHHSTSSNSAEQKARRSDGSVKELLLDVSVDIQCQLWQIELVNFEENTACFRETDLYKAMQTLRQYLEAKGYQLLCAGARPDVVPSGDVPKYGRRSESLCYPPRKTGNRIG